MSWFILRFPAKGIQEWRKKVDNKANIKFAQWTKEAFTDFFSLLPVSFSILFFFSLLYIFPLFLILELGNKPARSERKRPQLVLQMARVAGIFLCLLVVVMDVAAGILGFEAEMAQNKVKHLRVWIFECREPSHQAFMLGLGAAVLLILAHAIANLLGGCNCICSQQEFEKASSNRQLSVACLILIWIVLAVGLSTLVIGSMSNNRSEGSCGFSHHHFLSIGGISCFVHGLFCVVYYVSTTASMD